MKKYFIIPITVCLLLLTSCFTTDFKRGIDTTIQQVTIDTNLPREEIIQENASMQEAVVPEENTSKQEAIVPEQHALDRCLALERNIALERAAVFEHPYSSLQLGLWPIEEMDTYHFNTIRQQFGFSNVRGFTYFDFFGASEPSLVLFAESGYLRYGHPDMNIRDGIVIAEVNGELHYSWLDVGEFWPRIVAPFTYGHWCIDHMFYIPALLVVGTNVAGYESIFMITFQENDLQVNWWHPNNYVCNK